MTVLTQRHTLLLMRHAKSDWSGGHTDRERPIGARGRREAPEAGRWLAENLGRIDLAVVSPAARARMTWELVSAELREPPPVVLDEDVYQHATGPLLEVVRGLPEDATTVCLVGHNPDLEELALRLTGVPVTMPTVALTLIAVPSTWAEAGDGTGRILASGCGHTMPPSP
jgi:phosphohistidine phosphatase